VVALPRRARPPARGPPVIDELDDARLVGRIAAGDEAAFVIAYDRHSSYLFGSLVRFLGDREVAAEVVQDAFMALWRRAPQFDATAGSLLTWLLSIARHRAIDRLRAEGRRPLRDAASLDEMAGDGTGPTAQAPGELVAGAATDPGTVASRRWVQAVVRTGISELPRNEREVIVLGYSLDLSQAQIAERLEWPIGTVKSRTRRALAQLRSNLAGLADAEDLPTAGARGERAAGAESPRFPR
jgi:RNA polymerase sigma-70 factor (ECF subfamily)